MKKHSIVAVLLAAVLLVCTACKDSPSGAQQGNSANAGPGGSLAIDRVSGYREYSLDIEDGETVELKHVDRQSFPDSAQALQQMAEGCLQAEGISASVTDMYSVPLGLAGLEISYDPVILLTDSDEVNNDLIYMVPVCSGDQLICAGCFRDSQAEGQYRQVCSRIVSVCGDELAKALGLFPSDGTEYYVMFNIFRLNGLKTEAVPRLIEDCYNEARYRLCTFCLSDWRLPGQEGCDSDGYYTIQSDRIHSLDDVRSWLGEYFSDEISEYITANYSEAYKEEGGALKTMDLGIGFAIDLEDHYPVKVARLSEDHLYLIVEARRILVDWDDWNTDWENAPRYSQYYLFELQQSEKGWLFTDYTDIPYSFI